MKIVIAILAILFAVSWGTIIPVCISFWNNLKKVKADYDEAVGDGTITDAERVAIADDAMAAIKDASNIFQFITNLIKSILVVIQASKLTAKRLKAQRKK
jgi:heme oxygenase